MNFRGNLSPCKKHLKFLLWKFEASWFICKFPFQVPLLLSYTDLILFYWYIVALLETWVQFVGFSRFHLSSDSVFASSYRKFLLSLLSMCDIETSMFSRSSSFSSEGLYFISISANMPSNNRWLTVFFTITCWTDHIEPYVVRLDSTFTLYFMRDLIHSKETTISTFKQNFNFSLITTK